MRKNYLVQFGILIAMSQPNHMSAPPQNQRAGDSDKASLVLRVQPLKQVYAKGETIEFKFTLQNSGSLPILAARRLVLTQNIQLEITDPQGGHVKWCGAIVGQIEAPDAYKVLQPHDSVSALLVLSCVKKGDQTDAWGYLIEGSGKYVIRASYVLPQSEKHFKKLFPNEQTLRGPVTAEPVIIEVK